MKKILVLFAHPALQKSRVNSEILKQLQSLDGVTVHDLYQEYPEFDIDVAAEQELLAAHDIIVFHHPMFWYSTPAILKEWQDLVLEHNWAFGKNGDALKGKLFMPLITTGGPAEAYCAAGYNRFTIRQLLAPVEQTAMLCKMQYLPPYAVHGTHSITDEKIAEHVQNVKLLVEKLQQDQLPAEVVASSDYMNVHLTD